VAQIVDVAEAVVQELNAQSWSAELTATRSWRPQFDLEDLQGLRVTVVPRSVTLTRASRAEHQEDYMVDIGIQQRVSDLDADVDALVGLAEEIADHFRGLLLEDPEVVCTSVSVEPVAAPDHLEEMRTFTSVVQLTLRGWR